MASLDSKIITVTSSSITSLGQNLKSVTVTNLDSTNTIYFGDWALTTSFYGVRLLPGASVHLGNPAGVLCALASAGSPQLSMLFNNA